MLLKLFLKLLGKDKHYEEPIPTAHSGNIIVKLTLTSTNHLEAIEFLNNSTNIPNNDDLLAYMASLFHHAHCNLVEHRKVDKLFDELKIKREP